MTSLQDRVTLAISRHGLIPPGSRVLAAVSGGPDSVALVLLLLEAAEACGFTVAGIAHVNHGLRGRESDRDESFCRRLAADLGLPFEVRDRDVAALAKTWNVSTEAAARRARYECLAAAAATLGADRIATGHTRDDQAETFLLRVLRGAGAAGLAGIRPLRGQVVRPLLEIRREELRAYLAGRRQPFRTDSTNRDVTIPRNWVRHRLLPMLERRLNADIVEVLGREAAILGDEDRFLDGLAKDAAKKLSAKPAARSGLRLDVRGLNALPSTLARRVVRLALARVNPGVFYGFDHVERVLRLAGAKRGQAAGDLPGLRVERIGAGVVLYRRGAVHRRGAPQFRSQLAVPGRVEVLEDGWTVEATPAKLAKGMSPQSTVRQAVGTMLDMAVIDAGAAAGGLAVRYRRPGDAIRPLGLGGRKKLQDILVDRKVPRHERDRVPLVVDAGDHIVWIAGHVVAEEARVTDCTRGVVVLKLIRSGEEGDEA